MRRSGSHRATISTGWTWMRRKSEHLPYQPQPMRPTRSGFWASPAYSPDRARPVAAVDERKSRRFMGEHPEMGGPMGQWKQDSRGVRRAKGKTAAERTPNAGAARSEALGAE